MCVCMCTCVWCVCVYVHMCVYVCVCVCVCYSWYVLYILHYKSTYFVVNELLIALINSRVFKFQLDRKMV